MNGAVKYFGWLLGSVLFLGGQAYAQLTNRPARVISYTLLDGSYFVDDCLICGRPTIQQPLLGTFDLVLEQDFGTFIRYAVRNIDFIASPAWAGEVHITGYGTYERFEEFAVLQSMDLATEVKDSYTNKTAFFTNDSRAVEVPFPSIRIRLTQTNGTLLQTYSLELFARQRARSGFPPPNLLPQRTVPRPQIKSVRVIWFPIGVVWSSVTSTSSGDWA
jgi:hypothetical protein